MYFFIATDLLEQLVEDGGVTFNCEYCKATTEATLSEIKTELASPHRQQQQQQQRQQHGSGQ